MFSCRVYESFKNRSLRTTAYGTCSFGWSVRRNKLRFWLKLVLVPGFCFVIFVTVSFANFSFVTSTIDTTIIRNSRLVVFCQKGVLTNFAKFTIKHQRKSFIFKEAANLQSLNLSK